MAGAESESVGGAAEMEDGSLVNAALDSHRSGDHLGRAHVGRTGSHNRSCLT
jgi:hypothetical protein